MDKLEQERRAFLIGLGSLGLSQVILPGITEAQTMVTEGGVRSATEGEHLVHFRDHGNIYIKFGSTTGQANLALGTQQVTRAAGIPVHRHLEMDEAFYVLEGGGAVTLNDVPHVFDKGASIYIPRNTWHGFSNPDQELLVLWVVQPAGLDGFFRETCSPPGVPPKQLTREQINQIARKYATEFR